MQVVRKVLNARSTVDGIDYCDELVNVTANCSTDLQVLRKSTGAMWFLYCECFFLNFIYDVEN